MKEDLNGLDKAVSAVLGQRTIERNQLLVRIAKSKLTRQREDKNEKASKPEELVRLYDLLLQVNCLSYACAFNILSIVKRKEFILYCKMFQIANLINWLCLQNTADLSDLVSSGRDRKPEEIAFAEDCELKSLAFRAQRFASHQIAILLLFNFAEALLMISNIYLHGIS